MNKDLKYIPRGSSKNLNFWRQKNTFEYTLNLNFKRNKSLLPKTSACKV